MKKTYIKPEIVMTVLDVEEKFMLTATNGNTKTTQGVADNDDSFDEIDSYMQDGGELTDDILNGQAHSKGYSSWESWD